MAKLTHLDRPNQKIDYCRGIAIGLKFMLENGYNKQDLVEYVKYLLPDIAQNHNMNEWLDNIERSEFYDPFNKDSKKPTMATHRDFYNLLIKEYENYGEDSNCN